MDVAKDIDHKEVLDIAGRGVVIDAGIGGGTAGENDSFRFEALHACWSKVQDLAGAGSRLEAHLLEACRWPGSGRCEHDGPHAGRSKRPAVVGLRQRYGTHEVDEVG